MNGLRVRWESFMNNGRYRYHLRGVPFLFTFANALWGVVAIVKALEGELTMAVYCIMMAALMDACDGRCARALGLASNIGAELDSLADAISFCVAPAVLVYAWYPSHLGVSGMAALILYVCAGLYRLARFNTIKTQRSSDTFIGLPVPMAAFFVGSMVLYYHWMLAHPLWFVVYKRVPFALIAGIALLMISRIPFPSGKHYTIARTRSRIGLLIFGWIILLWLLMCGYPLLFFAITAYIAIGIFTWIHRYLQAR